MKILLVHVPKLEDFYLPFGRYMNVNYLPMGMLGLAAHLQRSGHPAEVVHAGVERLLAPDWTVADEVARTEARAVGLSLHWHYQAYDVSRAVERIKAARPDLFVFLGGLTASYFGRAVLETFPAADAVIKGEGHEPTRLLLDALESGGSLDAVPNLIRREGRGIVENRVQLHPPEFFTDLPFADLTLLRHHTEYVRQFGFPLAYSLELTREENRALMTMGRTFFPLFVGSGCRVSCSVCGGNARALAQAGGCNRILWRPQSAVMADIRRAMSAGYRTMALCFDPVPESTAYYVELFRTLREERLDVDFYFECWALPEPDFVTAFAATFKPPHSYLALSPDSGSDAIRRRNKGYFYTNDDLLRTADLLARHGVQMDVFFSLGFPGETVALALETRELMRRLSARYANIRRLMVWAVQLEPGSPMFERPEAHGVIAHRRRLADFVAAHGQGSDVYSELGYEIPMFFGDKLGFAERFQQFKCEEFCFHSRDPRVYNHPEMGRSECLEKRRMLARKRGAPEPELPISCDFTYAEAVVRERPRNPRLEV
jgi:radical SAM superfamily enzyme YgiQ (UPF0313 family)